MSPKPKKGQKLLAVFWFCRLYYPNFTAVTTDNGCHVRGRKNRPKAVKTGLFGGVLEI